MKQTLVLIALLTLIGCESLNLKTRDDIKGDSAAPAEGKAAAPTTPPPPPPPTMDDINAEIRSLRGQVEEAQNQVKQNDAAMQAMKDQSAKEKIASEQRAAALEEEIKKQNAQIDALTEKLNKPKPAAPADPAALIADGDDLVGAQKHKEAIVAYQKYRDSFPKGNRYAEATFKIGNSFQELGMKEEAKAFFEEVIGKFPKSPEAKKAAKRVKTLK